MNHQMSVLAAVSQSAKLKQCFEEYNRLITQAAGKEVSFKQRVALLSQAKKSKLRLEETIKQLVQSQELRIQRYSAEVFAVVKETAVRYQLMNGLYFKEEIDRFLITFNQEIPMSLREVLVPIIQTLEEGDYLILWNTGELEADAILSVARG